MVQGNSLQSCKTVGSNPSRTSINIFMFNKQQIFINYFSGASGHFFGSVIWILLTGDRLQLKRPNMALAESSLMNSYHNLASFWDYGPKQKLFNSIMDPQGGTQSASPTAIKSLVQFYDTPYNFYVAFIHCRNVEPIMLAFENAKLFNITIRDNEVDLDQVVWNWLSKVGRFNFKRLNDNLDFVKSTYGELLDVDEINELTSLDLMFYISKLRMQVGYKNFVLGKNKNYPSTYEIPFHEIMNGEIKNRINSIATFLKLDVSADTVDYVNNVIDNYVLTQTTVLNSKL